MDVLKHWLPRVRFVKWETGDPIKESPPATSGHTHCSAFVAAACFRLDIYILRPPEHSASFLASAQQEWLNSQAGIDKGWSRVDNALEAQNLANLGNLVVASWANPVPKKSGHIAIVRPSTWSEEQVAQDGPEIIQAGGTNYISTSVKQGFRGHPKAFENNEIQYHMHALGQGSKTQ